MFASTFKFEIKMLRRDRGFLLISLLLAALVWFANLNGQRQRELRDVIVGGKIEEKARADQKMVGLAREIESGNATDVRYYDNPTNPMGVGWKYPRLAVYQPDAASVLATGHSDIYRHATDVTVYGQNAYQVDLKEMRGPIQQMFGFFDLSVVLIYLFPLLALATSFNLIAGDKERGSLSLLLAQGVDLKRWLLARVLARYVALLAVLALAVPGSFAALGILDEIRAETLLQLAGLTALYGAPWFAAAYLINLQKGSAANHGFLLVVLWAAALLLVPGGLNQLARGLYPVPSRVSMINEQREAMAVAERAGGETFQQFYQQHPDLKPAEEAGSGSGRRWFMNYFAVQARAQEKIEPMLATFEAQMAGRARFIDNLGCMSPAIPFASSLNQVAGTSAAHYRSWQEQVGDFGQTWRDFVFPKVFHDQWLKPAELEQLPAFSYEPERVQGNMTWQVTLMFAQLLVLCLWALALPNPRTIETSP